MIGERAWRRGLRLGVDVRGALGIAGTLLKYLSVASIPATLLAIGYSDPFWPFLAAGAIAAAAGLGLELLGRGGTVGLREGFLVVALTWVFAAAFGSLPYVFAQEAAVGQPLNAYFEAMSGFTTTGASVIVDPSELSHSLLMWRQFTQWLGGMGIIVLALAVLPRLRVGGRQLLEHEMPGPEIEPLTSSIRTTARRLWLLYVALTAVLAVALAVVGWTGLDDEMNPFDAIAHALTTMPTGGFSTRATSIEAFAATTQWVVLGFMVLAGVNFALLYRVLVRGHLRAPLRDDEMRLYAGLLVIGSAILLVELLSEGVYRGEAAVRNALFEATAMMTGTGFASADYTQWTTLTAMTLVALMFVGGSAGSTTGSIKVVRHLLIARMLRRELDQTVHPELVQPVRLNRTVVDERTLRAVITFVLLYIGVFVVGAALLAIESARLELGVSPFDAIAAAASALGNVGPAFGFAGPVGSYEPFSAFSKVILIVLMWLGRLELLPVIVLFTRAYWRR